MHRLLRFCLLAGLIFQYGCGSAGAEAESPAPAGRPNVVVILVDDAGYVDFGFMGSEDLPTPNIDALALDGTVFTDAHVTASVCAPSRAGLLTGQYQQRFGFEANGTGGIGLSDDVSTIADVCQAAGYRTYALGKWHLGDDASDRPNQRGFDEFYGFLSGSRSYFPIDEPNPGQALRHNDEVTTFDGYLTDALGDRAAGYGAVQDDRPFFMYLSFNAVHTPMHAKEEDLERFAGHPRQTLAAMTWSLDENVGKLVAALKEQGTYDNTLFFFLSDNGGAHNNQSSTGPLKGWKGYKFEGGHRVPFFVSWPGKLPRSASHDGLTSSLDIFATVVDAIGADVPGDHTLDGVSLLPYLRDSNAGAPHDTLFWRKLGRGAARIGPMKYVYLEDYGSVLYDLSTDLEESTDLSREVPGKALDLERAYREWEGQLMDPLWDEGQNWMEVNRHVHIRLMQNQEPDYKDPGQRRRVEGESNPEE